MTKTLIMFASVKSHSLFSNFQTWAGFNLEPTDWSRGHVPKSKDNTIDDKCTWKQSSWLLSKWYYCHLMEELYIGERRYPSIFEDCWPELTLDIQRSLSFMSAFCLKWPALIRKGIRYISSMGLLLCSQSLSQYQYWRDYEVFDPSAWDSLYYHLKEGNPVYRKGNVSGAHD